ncbi:MAG: ABC transporter ATP-binding protein [Firmicutes bacterium]|nr:ABC transporter ATP-binding protein [Bacillota bacterium]
MVDRWDERAKGAVHEPSLALHIEDLTVSYDHRPVLWDIDLDIPPGVLAAVVGPNGAGKSTLVKAVLGMVKPAAGHVYVFGRPHLQQLRRIGYVPQRTTVDWDFPTTVLDVVMMGLYGQLGWIRRPGRAERRKAMDALEQVGMAAFCHRQISQLSGGQQQRVFLARALVQDAELYLLDEPMAGVDATTERHIIGLLKELRSRGKTLLVVHHDLQTLPEYFDWLVLLNVRIVAQGPLKQVYTLANLRQTYGSQIGLLHGMPAGTGGPGAESPGSAALETAAPRAGGRR